LTDVRFAGATLGIGGTDVKLFPLTPHPFTQHQPLALEGVKVEGVMEGVVALVLLLVGVTQVLVC
jgi:hypothetical protein